MSPFLAPLFFFMLPAAHGALSENAQSHLNEGVANLYDINYEQSRASFRKIIAEEPDNPFGYLFDSGGIWWQSSQEYGLFKDTPTLQGEFERDIAATLKKSELLLKSKDPKTAADAHFAAGMALGTRGQWALMRGHWMQACFDGRKAIRHLNKCIKADADYFDAYLGLGVYDYQAARLPALLKISAMFCGARGNAPRGLERMRLAMEKGLYGSRQAAAFLASIYITDKSDYARALELVGKLRGEFPNSPYFHFISVALRSRLGDAQGSLTEGKEFFERHQADMKSLNRKWLSLFCGLAADQCLAPDTVERAHAWFDLAIESAAAEKAVNVASASDPSSQAWLSLNHLLRGNAADILGKRETAIADYQWVVQHPDFSTFHARAKECLAAACDARQTLHYLRAMSRDEAWPARSSAAVPAASPSVAR